MLSWLITNSLRLRTIIVCVAAGLLVLAGWSLRDKTVDVIPEFSPLSIIVKTEALGLASAEVEALITVPLEADLLNGVPWLQVIKSESMVGLSTIELTFMPGTDLMKARQLVQERLTQAHALPQVSAPPNMLQPVSTASRVMNVGLSSKTVSVLDMSIQARWNIVPRLLGVPGVANVSIWGQRERQVQVHVDAQHLKNKDVKLEQVVKTAGEAVWSSPLTYLNSSTPGTGGFIETPNQRLNIRHQLPITDARTFQDVAVAGSTTRIREIAHVVDGHQPLIGDAIIGEGPGLMLAIEKFPGANTVEVTRGVERALAEMKAGLPGVLIDTTIYRPASFIERATGNLGKALIISFILVAVTLGLLMSSWRTAVIALVGISMSFVSAGLLLHVAGVSLSMMTVAGLLMAAAVIVHDSILDCDNALRRLRAPHDGRSSFLVIIRAMLETRRPMLYASVIIVLAVLPVLFMQTQSAGFFAPTVWAYIAAVAASTAVALTVTPALAGLLLAHAPLTPQGGSPVMNMLAGLFNRACGAVTRAPAAGISVGILATVACIAAWFTLERQMVPTFKETDLVVEWQGPPGTSLPAMNRVTESLIRDLRQIRGVQDASASLGRALFCNCERATDVNTGKVWVNIDPNANYQAVVDAVEAAVTAYPGMRGHVGTYLTVKLHETLTGAPDLLTVRVYGRNGDIVRDKAEEIRGLIAKVPGINNAKVEFQVEEPSIEVKVDVDKAAKHGLRPGDIRRATSTMVGGITVGSLFQEQKIFDVVVWGHPELRDNLDDVRSLLLDSGSDDGKQVRLDQVADVRIAPAISIIRRQGSLRRIDVTAQVDGRSLSAAAGDVANKIRDVRFPFEHHAEVIGEYTEERVVLQSIYSYMAAAAVLIFLLAQTVLRSWALTALSVLGVPIAVVGSLATIWVTRGGFSLGSLMGLWAVLALTVRQGIDLVAHFQHLQLFEGEPFGEALVQRGLQEKFPSIMATSVTAFVLMVPFAILGNVAGLEIAHPLAVAVLGGLVTSTLGTLLVLPALYARFGAGWTADRLDLEMDTVS